MIPERQSKKKISLVVPVFNEAEAVPLFYREIASARFFDHFDLEIVFIDDGSTDGTSGVIAALPASAFEVALIAFSRNFGKEAALSAGVKYATGDAVIPMDVDLQDPIDVIPKLIEQWERGFEVVLAKRADRSSDSTMKRTMANAFYRLHNKIANLKIEENVGDFRLMDRVVVNAVNDLPENCRFMKGLFAWVGFRQTCVEYVRPPRSAGKTKFNGWRLWNFALEGVTSFSTVPLRVWTYLGGLIALISFFYGVYMILAKLVLGNPVPGYPSLMVTMLFLGGVQLIGIGVLGEYIGRTYIESKRRPLHIVRQAWRRAPDGASHQVIDYPRQRKM